MTLQTKLSIYIYSYIEIVLPNLAQTLTWVLRDTENTEKYGRCLSLSSCDRSAVSPAPVPLAESGCSPVTSLVTNRVERFRFCPTYQSISVRRRCTLVWVGQRDTLYCSTVRCDATYPGAMRYIVFRKLKFILCHGHIMPSSVRYTILT